MADNFDVLIVGAGAAGLMCALTAAQRGRRVLLLDHTAKLAEKIRISGGGRCNFSNLNAGPENYLSGNPHFCRSALARYTPQHFIGMLQRHGIGFHEKTLGQLFCDDGSEAIIAMLKAECDAAGVRWCMTTGRRWGSSRIAAGGIAAGWTAPCSLTPSPRRVTSARSTTVRQPPPASRSPMWNLTEFVPRSITA